MGDTLNSLLQAQHSSSVLDSIAHPSLVNPLAAINSGNQAASSVYDLRQKQANEAAGQAFQASIDPATGMPNQALLMRNLANNPRAAMAAQSSAQAGQTLSTNQLGFDDAQQAQIGRVFGSMINQPDSAQTPAAYKAALLQLHANGTLDDSHLAAANAGIDALGPNPDPTTLRQTGTRMLMTALSTAEIAKTALPQMQMMHGPQGDMPYLVQPPVAGAEPGAGMQQQRGGFAAGQAPQPGQVPDTRPGAPPGTYTPVIPPGGGGTQPLAGSAPARPTPPVPSPIPGGGVYRPPAATPAPATPAPTTSSPAAPGTSPAAPSITASPTPNSNQQTYTAPPAGQGDVLQKDIDASTAANVAMGDQQKRLIAGQHALEALRLADTGPATGFVARANAFFKAQGITTVPQGQLSDTDYRQLLQKNLLRFAQSSGKTSGTDLGLETQLHANANADEMLTGANRTVLVQDMGVLKRDIAQTQEMPAASATGDVVKHIGSFQANIAPEAFMWNSYSKQERNAIEADYAKKGQTQKLHDSLALAVKRGAIPDPTKTPPAAVVAPPAVVATPPAPRVPLSLVTPNPLSAYG